MASELRDRISDIKTRLQLYLEVKRFAAAEKLIDEAISEMGEIAILFNLKGICFHAQSKFQDAIDSFEKAAIINPNFTEALVNLSLSYADVGQYEDAQEWYRKAQSEGKEDDHMDSESDTAHQGLDTLSLGRIANKHVDTGLAYKISRLWDEAISEFEKALTLYPHMPDVIIELADTLIRTKQYQKARLRLLDYDKHFTPDPRVYNLLGLIAFKEGDFISSKNRWRQSQDIRPTDSSSKAMLKCLTVMNTEQS